MRILSSPSLSALDVLSVSMQVTANNIANMNTNGFKAMNVQLETSPFNDGVRLAGISVDKSPGSLVNFTGQGVVETSNTNLAREFTNMISTETAWKANIASIVTADQMLGSLLDSVA